MPWPGPDGARPLPALPVPRPEHPRPDFRRPDWLNLNGWWDFAFDPEDRGRDQGWCDQDVAFPDRILVPFPWESPAAWGDAAQADEARFYAPQAYREPVSAPARPVRNEEWHRQHNAAQRHEIGWYRRRFQTPAAWAGRRIFVVVSACDFEAEVYCNGVPVGKHTGGYGPFACELSGVLAASGSDNILVLCAHDPQDHGDQPGGKQHWWYERTSGIWQTVYLEARPEAYLTHLRVTPNLREGRVRVDAGICPVAGDYEVRVTATSPHGEVFSGSVICPGCERRSVDLALGSDLVPWSPESPDLYDLTVEVTAPAAGPEATDTVHSYFGLRDVGVGRLPGTDIPCITLNGAPFYVRAALHQSFHPAGIYSYVDDQIIRDDLEAAKAAGLNALRLHIKVDDPRLYYWADRLGVAILYDLPNTGNQNSRARRLWEKTLREAIARDGNHPSILLWVLFNETWGLGEARAYKQDLDTQAWVAAMVQLCRALDPSRLIEDNSPCNHDHVVTDVHSWHFYINDPAHAARHLAEVVERTYPGSGWNYVPGRTQGHEPLINSEYGGIGAGDGDRDVSYCLRWLTAGLRRHPQITGYVYTELTDVEWEHNGLVRYDRLPKAFPYDLRDVLGADVLLVDGAPLRTADPGATLELPVAASIFSARGDGAGEVRWAVRGWDTGGRRLDGAAGRRPVVWRGYGVTEFGILAVPAPRRHGLYQVRLELVDTAGARVCGTTVDFQVGPAGPGLPALASEGFSGVHTKDDQYWVGQGAGLVRCELERRGNFLVFEAAAGVVEPRQTDAERTPAEISVRADGQRLGAFRLPDAPADARGILSYQAGIPGAYGYLLRLPLPAGGATVRVEIACGAGGLALFGGAAGAYPVGLAVEE